MSTNGGDAANSSTTTTFRSSSLSNLAASPAPLSAATSTSPLIAQLRQQVDSLAGVVDTLVEQNDFLVQRLVEIDSVAAGGGGGSSCCGEQTIVAANANGKYPQQHQQQTYLSPIKYCGECARLRCVVKQNLTVFLYH
jgi:hypothetical protein